MLVRCTCGRKLRVKEKHLGERVRCPACGTILRVPDLADPPSDAEPTESVDIPLQQEAGGTKRRWLWPGVAAGVACLAVTGALYQAHRMHVRKHPELYMPQPRVRPNDTAESSLFSAPGLDSDTPPTDPDPERDAPADPDPEPEFDAPPMAVPVKAVSAP